MKKSILVLKLAIVLMCLTLPSAIFYIAVGEFHPTLIIFGALVAGIWAFALFWDPQKMVDKIFEEINVSEMVSDAMDKVPDLIRLEMKKYEVQIQKSKTFYPNTYIPSLSSKESVVAQQQLLKAGYIDVFQTKQYPREGEASIILCTDTKCFSLVPADNANGLSFMKLDSWTMVDLFEKV